MKAFTWSLRLLLGALLLCPPPAWALARTYVSGTGSNTNPCTREAPCRSIARGIARVDAGGEVVILDSAPYAPFTVAKAVTVLAAPGIHAGITVTTGTGITVTAGATDIVILRGLTLTGLGGEIGIHFQAGQALHVERMVIHGFGVSGIQHAAGQLFVTDTVIRNSSLGVVIAKVAGLVRASLERVQLVRNGNGLLASNDARVTTRDCVAAASGEDGLIASSGTAAAEPNIENCVVANNPSGIGSVGVGGAAVVRVSNSTVTNNLIGLHAEGSNQLLSRGNNTVAGNMTNAFGTIGTFTAK